MVRDEVLLQEFYNRQPWHMMVCCVLLNNTTRRQVDYVLDELFEKYPDPGHMASAKWDDLSRVIAPCGLQNQRAIKLIKMSNEWLRAGYHTVPPLYREQIEALTGLGEYAADSYMIFFLQEKPSSVLDVTSQDKEIIAWLRRQEEMDNVRVGR